MQVKVVYALKALQMEGLMSRRASFLQEDVELFLGSPLVLVSPWMSQSSLECAFGGPMALTP